MTISETSKGKARRSTLYKLKQLNRNAPNSLNQVKNEKMGAGGWGWNAKNGATACTKYSGYNI